MTQGAVRRYRPPPAGCLVCSEALRFEAQPRVGAVVAYCSNPVCVRYGIRITIREAPPPLPVTKPNTCPKCGGHAYEVGLRGAPAYRCHECQMPVRECMCPPKEVRP